MNDFFASHRTMPQQDLTGWNDLAHLHQPLVHKTVSSTTNVVQRPLTVYQPSNRLPIWNDLGWKNNSRALALHLHVFLGSIMVISRGLCWMLRSFGAGVEQCALSLYQWKVGQKFFSSRLTAVGVTCLGVWAVASMSISMQRVSSGIEVVWASRNSTRGSWPALKFPQKNWNLRVSRDGQRLTMAGGGNHLSSCHQHRGRKRKC